MIECNWKTEGWGSGIAFGSEVVKRIVSPSFSSSGPRVLNEKTGISALDELKGNSTTAVCYAESKPGRIGRRLWNGEISHPNNTVFGNLIPTIVAVVSRVISYDALPAADVCGRRGPISYSRPARAGPLLISYV